MHADALADAINQVLTASDINKWIAAVDLLEESKDRSAIPALVQALNDPNYRCVCAALALGEIGDPRAIPHLLKVLNDKERFWVPRGAAAVALGLLGQAAAEALPALEEALTFGPDEKWDIRAREAVEDAIGHITNPNAPCRLKGRGYRFEMWGIY